MRTFCSGREIAEALKSGSWPDGCDPELRAHVAGCRSCSDLVLITQAFQKARGDSLQAVGFDSPGLLWWKAQLRRKNAAVEQVGKPITVAQTFALLVNLLVAGSILSSLFPHGFRPGLIWSRLMQSHAFHWEALWSFSSIPSILSIFSMRLDGAFMLLIPSVGLLALLSGVVVYLAAEKP